MLASSARDDMSPSGFRDIARAARPAVGSQAMDVQERKWTRVEYERLVELEILGPEDRVELIGGAMICKEPQYSPHATAIQLVLRVLTDAFGLGWVVRPQMPVSLDDESMPEPDVCVVPGDPRDYRDAHPTRPVLMVEVALSRLGFDRDRKGSLYARADLADYWIVNLPDRRLEVYRGPVPDGAARFGWRYGSAQALSADQRVSPLAKPGASVCVADLLP
jgi:Uma2 family endonuclease